ncbi:1-phosphatidylinositol 4-kinase [Gracilaria domingensis]|nr:1-phosphatidylinositol 4-kinase [Gracilaria domingensis]
MHFNALQLADEVKLKQWLEARHERANLFHAELDFVKCLTHISNGLFDVERELRRDVLRRELEKLNDFIPNNVFIPTERRPHRVLRIVPEEAHVFNTKERVPYLLVVEVEDLSVHAPEKEHPSDDHRGSSPLRRIGSLSSPPGRQHAHQPPPESHEPEITVQNQPADKFEFSPDVTADVRQADADFDKRESSFRVDTKFDDDKRPPDEELLKALGERWAVKSERLRKSSSFGSNPNWRLVSCIVKARDQLRQEMFAQRLIQEFSRIFEKANIPCWLRPYEIISTSGDSGLIETVTDAKSIDSIKKHSPNVTTLKDYFVGVFGGRGSHGHKRAVRNFVHSMAGYSIIQYLMNIKDRHNGNLMIDAEGHIIHIDFGFLLSNSPGGNMEFEKAPFKLTEEMVQVMGGTNSGAFKLYRKLCVQGYLEACRYANKILLMVDTMYPGNETMPCFLQGRDYVLTNLRDRLGFELSKKDKIQRMSKLVDYARGNWTTRAYDHFQKVSMGISK